MDVELVKRLVNHAPSRDVTEGYASDFQLEQLREPAQRIADTLEAHLSPSKESSVTHTGTVVKFCNNLLST